MIFRNANVEDAAGIARVHLAVQRQVYQDIFPEHILNKANQTAAAADKRKKLLEDSQGLTCTFAAVTDTGEVIGYAAGGANRYWEWELDFSAELYNLFVLEEFQHQKIGSRLFLHVIEFLRKQNHNSLLLWVVQDTPAVAYYQKLSGEEISERLEKVEGYAFNMLCFGWRDLALLHERLSH